MQTLAEGVFTGTWKSFKVFKRSGDVRLHSEKSYRQFHFEAGGKLTILDCEGARIQIEAETDRWTIDFKDRRHYLVVTDPKMSYEVLTVNHVVMVLADPISGEKVFFARAPYWHDYLKSNRQLRF